MDLNFAEAQLSAGIPGFEFCREGSGTFGLVSAICGSKFGAQVGHGIHRGIVCVRVCL